MTPVEIGTGANALTTEALGGRFQVHGRPDADGWCVGRPPDQLPGGGSVSSCPLRARRRTPRSSSIDTTA
jgi:hypothetical protein